MKVFEPEQYIIIKKGFFWVFIFFLLVSLFFADTLFTGKMFFYRDVMLQFYPWHNFSYESIQNLKIPFWNPYVYSGYPHFANMQSAVLYPLKLPMYILPSVEFGYKLFAFLHVFLAGLGFYLLLRYYKRSYEASFFGALIFSFATSTIARCEFLSVLASITWVPYIFYCYRKLLEKKSVKYFVLLIFFEFLQILAGNPQSVFYTFLLLFIYSIYFAIKSYNEGESIFLSLKSVIFLLFPAFVAAALSAFQLLPFKEFVSFSSRSSGINDFSLASLWSLDLKDLLNIIFPFFWGNPGTGTYYRTEQFWIKTFYIGAITSILCLFPFFKKEKRKIALLCLGLLIIIILLALGSNTFIYKFLYDNIPGFNLVRYPAAIMFLSVFVFALLSSFGFDVCLENIEESTDKKKKTALMLTILFFLGFISASLFLIFKNGIISSYNPAIASNAFLNLRYGIFAENILKFCVFSFLFSALYFLSLKKIISRKIFINLVIAIVALDLFIADIFLLPKTKIINYKNETETIKYIKNDKSQFRIMVSPSLSQKYWQKYYYEILREGGTLNSKYLDDSKSVIATNLNMYYGIYSAEGYDPMSLVKYNKVLDSLKAQTNPSDSMLLDLLNIKYVLSSDEIKSHKLNFVSEENGIKLYINKECMTRAFIVNKVIYYDKNSNAINLLKKIDPRKEVLIQSADESTEELFGEFKSTIPEIINIQPEEIILKVDIDHECVLVLTDVYYPGWKVQVDNIERQILNADMVFKGVYLRKGDKSVKFYYDPVPFKKGLIISISTFLIIALLFAFRRKIERIFQSKEIQIDDKKQNKMADFAKKINIALGKITDKIPKKELIFVIFWSILIVSLTLIPYNLASKYTAPGMKFMGFFSNVYDQNSYLSWIEQGKEGKVLFEQNYTSEKHKPALFHPLFYILGKIAGIFSIESITIYHIARFATGLILLILCYYFCGLFFRETSHKLLCFILISLSSGMGWIFPSALLNKLSEMYQIMPVDLWVPESNTFLSLLLYPLFSASQILIILTFMFAIQSYLKNNYLYSVLSGISLLLLGLVHGYDVLTIYVSFLIFFVFLVFLHKINIRQSVKYLLVIVLISMPSVLYQLFILNTNQVFEAWKSQSLTKSPNPYSYIIGFGFTGILAVIGAIYSYKEKKPENSMLLSWLLAFLVLAYMPLGFERRLVMGVHILLCILAIKAVVNFKIDKTLVVIAIIALTMQSNIKFIIDHLADVNKFQLNYNLYENDLKAFEWLKNNAKKDDVILCSLGIGVYIPGRTGRKVYLGHYDQTVNFPEKLKYLGKFYDESTSDDFRLALLKINNIKYIYYGEFERYMGTFKINESSFLEKCYENEGVKIFRVR